jgi:hypothetical protein
MLDLVYLALVALPLTLAAFALLLIAVRSFRGASAERAERRAVAVARAEAQPGGMRKREAPMAEPPSIATLPDVRALGRTLKASLDVDPPVAPAAAAATPPPFDELAALVESLARSPAESLRAADLRRPHIGAPAAQTKICPDCAEEILAAARVCKHCRCRFDEPGDERLSA